MFKTVSGQKIFDLILTEISVHSIKFELIFFVEISRENEIFLPTSKKVNFKLIRTVYDYGMC